MFSFITKKLTKNLSEIPLFWVTFNLNHYKNNGELGSCNLNVHPNLRNDIHIKKKMNELVDYIRKNYDMEDMI